MHKQTGTISVGGQAYRVTWDMYAMHLLEKGGNPSRLETIHAGIAAAAASEDKPEPVSLRQLGGMFRSVEELDEALTVVLKIAIANGHVSAGDSDSGKAESEAKPAASSDATNEQPLILGSASESSGVSLRAS